MKYSKNTVKPAKNSLFQVFLAGLRFTDRTHAPAVAKPPVSIETPKNHPFWGLPEKGGF